MPVSLPEDPEQAHERLLEDEARGRLPRVLAFWGHAAKTAHPGPWTLSQWWPVPFEVDGRPTATPRDF